MAFKVKLFYGLPDFEALQVAKLDQFEPVRASYRPYSQARVCFSPEGLHLQLLSFETLSLPDSLLEAVIALPGKSNNAIYTLRLYADGRYETTLNGAPDDAATLLLQDVVLHPFSGEDLQGVYWGGSFTLPFSRNVDFDPLPGANFTGNFYKLCTDPQRVHQCSFFPADFSKSRLCAENLGDFTVIDY